MRRLLLAAAVLAGCASAEQAVPDSDRDLSVATIDDLAGPVDRGGALDMAACIPARRVVINEVQTGSAASANDEFIELYNPCRAPLDVGNWTLVYRSATGMSDVLVAQLANGQMIPGGGYLLIAGPAYAGTDAGAADQTYGTGRLAQAGGGLALRDATTTTHDSVGWGTATNIFVEGAAAPAPADGQSIARKPDGADTNHNDVDFQLAPTPTPKAGN